MIGVGLKPESFFLLRGKPGSAATTGAGGQVFNPEGGVTFDAGAGTLSGELEGAGVSREDQETGEQGGEGNEGGGRLFPAIELSSCSVIMFDCWCVC